MEPPDDTLRGLTAVSGGISEGGIRSSASKRPVSRDLTILHYKAFCQLFNDVIKSNRCYLITKTVFSLIVLEPPHGVAERCANNFPLILRALRSRQGGSDERLLGAFQCQICGPRRLIFLEWPISAGHRTDGISYRNARNVNREKFLRAYTLQRVVQKRLQTLRDESLSARYDHSWRYRPSKVNSGIDCHIEVSKLEERCKLIILELNYGTDCQTANERRGQGSYRP